MFEESSGILAQMKLTRLSHIHLVEKCCRELEEYKSIINDTTQWFSGKLLNIYSFAFIELFTCSEDQLGSGTAR